MNKVGLKQNGRFYYGWVLMLIGFVLMSLAYTGSISVTSVFVVPVTEDFGIDRGSFLLYQTVLTLTAVVVTAYFGKRMAKGRLKLIVVISALVAAGGYLLFAAAKSVYWFYFGAVLIGVGFTNCTVLPMSIILNNWFGGKVRGTVMGFCFVGSGVGGLVILPILNSVIINSGWRSGYVALAGMFGVVALLSLLFLVKTPEERKFIRMGETAEEVKAAENAAGMNIKEAMKTPMFWLILATATLMVFGSSAILFNSAPFFIECGFNAQKAALIASFNLGMLAVGKIFIGFLSDRLGTKFASILSGAIFGLAFVSLALMPMNPGLFVFGAVICYGIGGGGITVCPPLLVNALFGEKDYGNIVAAMNMATNLGGAVGGTIAGVIYDVTGSYVAFWCIAAAMMALVVVFRIIAFALRKKYTY
ncbi:MFS transporter [Anaerovorax odorimutans]|uniref:MFS transporter n=1 Tax=Anaerovorax odorimutans TaxID=109327 RepID=A0ABT1RMV5_9FIRM|nr:MFS transporter [Anaerovorax odorimutans]MCQ4636519.1 MFS transporter [Anaerovorax odorimutans]